MVTNKGEILNFEGSNLCKNSTEIMKSKHATTLTYAYHATTLMDLLNGCPLFYCSRLGANGSTSIHEKCSCLVEQNLSLFFFSFFFLFFFKYCKG
jgi:hypothetical protein